MLLKKCSSINGGSAAAPPASVSKEEQNPKEPDWKAQWEEFKATL
jgi:hypothetical protein